MIAFRFASQVLEGLRLLSEVSGRAGSREQADVEAESQPVRLLVLLGLEQDQTGG